mmetsp:Transcript_95096/g.183337  ORF Transcript_95096/g.183337 Transcript_95096/m.183337 type:complete len:94 (+) Transcript_95096:1256-1537(+)
MKAFEPSFNGQVLEEEFEALDPQLPWKDFGGFVSHHFRFLLTQLDKVLSTWARWAPSVAVDLMRSFASWIGPLNGNIAAFCANSAEACFCVAW